MAGKNRHKASSGHEIVSCAVYGPVRSRRFGTTLGVNPLPPGVKHCNFNCVYCQLGWSERGGKRDVFPAVPDIVAALRRRLNAPIRSGEALAAIVISGNGEPTLHPEFPRLVTELRGLRARLAPGLPLVSFTNGTTLADKNIARALASLDECQVKIDARARAVNLPGSAYDVEAVARATGRLRNLVVQSCFFAGRPGNIGAKDVAEWASTVARLRPRRVDIYTVTREPASPGVLPAPRRALQNAARRLRGLGIRPVRVFGP